MKSFLSSLWHSKRDLQQTKIQEKQSTLCIMKAEKEDVEKQNGLAIQHLYCRQRFQHLAIQHNTKSLTENCIELT